MPRLTRASAAQVHEWGGVFADIVTYSHYRQFAPGLRISINPHGGHYWSTQARHLRPSSPRGRPCSLRLMLPFLIC